jgi:protein gp37
MTGGNVERIYDYNGPDDYYMSNGWDGNAHFFPERLEEPFHLRTGKERPHRIFVCSMSDLFHESLSNEQIAAVFGVMAATPRHQYVVLTKRLERAVEWFNGDDGYDNDGFSLTKEWLEDTGYEMVPYKYFERIFGGTYFSGQYGDEGRCELSPGYEDIEFHWPLPNAILCASVEDQKSADERIPLLLQCPAAYHGVSVEPMLGPVDINLPRCEIHDREFVSKDGFYCTECAADGCGFGGEMPYGHWIACDDCIDLVICGAETGPKKRPFRDEWGTDLMEQCRSANVPFFFKRDGQGRQALCGVEYREWVR